MIKRRNILEKKVAELKKVINIEYFEEICEQDADKRNEDSKEELVEEINKML